MAAAYMEQAVKALADYLRTNLPAQLRIVETDHGLTANSIPDPAQVLDYKAPADTTSPSLQVFCSSGSQTNPNSGLFSYDVDVVIVTTYNANLSAGAALLRRYVTAVLRCIGGAPSLGGEVSGAFVTDLDPLIIHGDDGPIRHLCGIGCRVTVHNPLTC